MVATTLGDSLGNVGDLRLGEAEVGFAMHIGAMKTAGVDVTSDEMASLCVATNGVAVTAVLVVPDPDEDFYCELEKVLCGMNYDPWMVK